MSKTTDKKILPALLLYMFFGVFSAHRFYVGKWKSALIQIFTLGGLLVWWAIDFFRIITGNFQDKNGVAIKEWT